MTTAETPTIEPTTAPTYTPLRMSYDEYLAWDYEDGLTEWVNGEVIIHMPVTNEHQRVVDFLNRLLGLFVKLFALGVVRSAPYAMRVRPDGSGREPDLFFLAAEHMNRLTSKQLVGPADLVIEVISTESVARDRADKFYEYQEAGIPEYWMFDPRPGKERVDFYVLDEHGRYQPVPVPADGIYHSTILPNFWLKIAWLWQDDPNPLAALAEIVGVEQVMAALRQSV